MADAPPRLADGVDLMGEYEGSGFKTPHYMVRRGDGQVVQITELLHLVAAACDGRRDTAAIAEEVSARHERRVSARNVEQVLAKRLRPLGIVAAADGSSPELKRLDPMMALRFRAALIKPGVVRAITTLFKPLFLAPVVVIALLGLGVVDGYVFFVHGLAQAMRELLYQPLYLLLLLGLVILSAAFHEAGHAAACKYSGATPGVMGAGIYMVWPAFYTDVTDAYRLGRGGRLRTDLGGVYFNCIFILATAGLYFATHFEPLLAIILFQHIEVIHQLLPFLRLDGYYIVADLTGVPDMFTRIKPTLLSLLPWRRTDERVAELKTWVRVAVTAWVLVTIPILLYVYGMLVVNFPRLLGTAWDSLHQIGGDLGDAVTHAHVLNVLLDVVQIIALCLPIAGVVLTLWRLMAKIGGVAWSRTEGSPIARGVLVVGAAALLAFTAFAFVPRTSNYSPIGPQEKGTVQAGTANLGTPVTGQPLYTTDNGGSPAAPANAPGPSSAPQPSAQPSSAASSSSSSSSSSSLSSSSSSSSSSLSGGGASPSP